ncbi:sporulation protein [Streptomyces sp. BI20]|uniref:sporulation protein n=1 Tax=Streptomyces sp. BI20 TaxID=3403460 RepID=UPI003C773CD9
MVFKRLLGAIGVGGPTVDTVLDPTPVLPGGPLTGEVRLTGGKADFDIDHVTLDLLARVEAETHEGEHEGTLSFERHTVGGGFRLREGESRVLPFSLTLPWETPITELYGQPLGIVLGVRTELGVAGAKDKGDLDPLAVRPLPSQEAVLEALGSLGFAFGSADLEYGRIAGTAQALPCYQEIELAPAARYRDRMIELELTFLAGPTTLEVVLEADKRGGFLGGGGDAVRRFTLTHEAAAHTDLVPVVTDWIETLLAGRTAHTVPAPYDHHADHHPDKHEGHGRSGPGIGTAVAAGAAGLAVGVVGGMVAAEAVDEIGDWFEDEDEADDES